MDAKEYRRQTVQTWNTEPPEKYQLANAALGIVGEAREFADDRHTDEAGDLLYYLTTLRRLVDMPVIEGHDGGFRDDDLVVDDMRWTAEKLAEAVKKHVFHGDDKAERIDHLTWHIEWCVYVLTEAYSNGIEYVREQNIEKLRDRHGSSFSPADEQSR